MLLLLLLGVVTVLCVVHVLFNCIGDTNLIRKIPSPGERFLIGNALEIFVTPVELFYALRSFAKKFNGIYSLWTLGLRTINIYNPNDVETIIATTKHNDKSFIYGFLKAWMREGLLLSKGLKWHQRRKILTPTFHFNILRQFCAIMEENGQKLVEELENTKEAPTDVVPIITEYTFNSICETAMGTKLREASYAGSSYKDAVYNLGNLVAQRVSNVILFPDFTFQFSSLGRKAKKHLDIVHSFSGRVIKERKEYLKEKGLSFEEQMADNDADDLYLYKKKKKVAMLDLLLSAEKEGSIDRAGVQEEVDNFMVAGHATTASGLVICLMLIANHKHVQDKLAAELKATFGDSTELATTETLSKLRYMECCVKESLRLYPPVHFISRRLAETTKLSDYTVPAGTVINIHIYDLHRREDLFKNATVFDPDRFLPENNVGRHPFSYIPFSAGPRNCIGQKFAMLEMKSCLAAVLRKFELLPVTTPKDIEFVEDLVLRTTHPVYVKFVERKQ